jgi:drug/metabolite transporter (DMT)-like permease
MSFFLTFQCKPKYIATALFGLLYTASSSGETLVVKALNYANEPLTLPGYTALLSNQLWIFMIPIYLMMRTKGDRPFAYMYQYIGMGTLLFIITLFRNISLNILPGSVFSLLISTSIVFNMFLSWFFLKKTFNKWHLCATVFCLASALSIGVSAILVPQETRIDEMGVLLAIGSAFFIALMGVWQEYLLPFWSNVNLRIVELTLVSSVVASALIVLFSAVSGEFKLWAPALKYSTESTSGRILVVCVSFALPILKLLVRNSKYSAIQNSNAFFFEFIQASSALLCSVASILLFNEPWSVGYSIAFVCMTLSFMSYIQAKRLVNSMKEKAKLKRVDNPIILILHNPLENASTGPKTMSVVRSWK